MFVLIITIVQLLLSKVMEGGEWRPIDCIAGVTMAGNNETRDKVAVFAGFLHPHWVARSEDFIVPWSEWRYGDDNEDNILLSIYLTKFLDGAHHPGT